MRFRPFVVFDCDPTMAPTSSMCCLVILSLWIRAPSNVNGGIGNFVIEKITEKMLQGLLIPKRRNPRKITAITDVHLYSFFLPSSITVLTTPSCHFYLFSLLSLSAWALAFHWLANCSLHAEISCLGVPAVLCVVRCGVGCCGAIVVVWSVATFQEIRSYSCRLSALVLNF